ncbi:MAG: tetratricopeptide repeat protein [Coriobacteriia bacterium]|nr:tetratricopeptide repeat protein [Coriobacteriia bacterium]MBN2823508.1 tetratricopeptide repeat protein [Coriobacteriia bacterium]
MDDARFQQGVEAYKSRDFRVAAREFLGATTGNNDGLAYHQAGNALMRLKRYDDAAAVYRKALNDGEYERRSSVQANLGAALVAGKHPEESLAAYQAALDDPGYDCRYKALQGMAGALLELGHAEKAADSYRMAALDDANPDPGKALNNLGLAYMSLGRPQDAVEAYRAAVDMDRYAGRGKASANLGMAYVALGMHEKAARAFERAGSEFDYELPAAAVAAFEASTEALARPEVVEGWRTGELPPLDMTPRPDISAELQEPVSEFFTRTDSDMKASDREERKRERVERRSSRNVWLTVAVWSAVGIALFGVLAFAWLSGIGYPTQTMTVTGLLDAHAEGASVSEYWVAVPTADVEKEMGNLPVDFTYELGAVERSAKTSKVVVTVMLETGAPLTYQVLMVREGVGWKVNGITNDWRSTGGGS